MAFGNIFRVVATGTKLAAATAAAANKSQFYINSGGNGNFVGNVDSSRYKSHTLIGSNIQLSDSSEDIAKLIRSHGIYDKHQMDWYKKFSRFGIIDPYNAMTNTKEYIFFTKPDLNLLTSSGDLNPDLKKVPFFIDAYERYRPLMETLQYSYSANSGPFVALISNAVQSGLELPGVSATSIETADNIYGVHQNYRWTSSSSHYDADFSLEFLDTKYLEVYMLFRIYDEYEELKSLGMVSPRKDQIYNKVLHDQMTAYKIVVGEDGMSIRYFARITGVYPLGTNRDAFSDMNNTDGQKLSISFKGFRVRDMDPRILVSFNRCVASRISGRADLPLYDTTNHHVNGSWSSCPYILTDNRYRTYRDKMAKYYLGWKE